MQHIDRHQILQIYQLAQNFWLKNTNELYKIIPNAKNL